MIIKRYKLFLESKKNPFIFDGWDDEQVEVIKELFYEVSDDNDVVLMIDKCIFSDSVLYRYPIDPNNLETYSDVFQPNVYDYGYELRIINKGVSNTSIFNHFFKQVGKYLGHGVKYYYNSYELSYYGRSFRNNKEVSEFDQNFYFPNGKRIEISVKDVMDFYGFKYDVSRGDDVYIEYDIAEFHNLLTIESEYAKYIGDPDQLSQDHYRDYRDEYYENFDSLLYSLNDENKILFIKCVLKDAGEEEDINELLNERFNRRLEDLLDKDSQFYRDLNYLMIDMSFDAMVDYNYDQIMNSFNSELNNNFNINKTSDVYQVMIEPEFFSLSYGESLDPNDVERDDFKDLYDEYISEKNIELKVRFSEYEDFNNNDFNQTAKEILIDYLKTK